MKGLHAALASSLVYLPGDEQKEVLRALDMAEQWHTGQTREAGGDYIEHPVAVAMYLTKLEAPAAVLQAALLHDVVEDNRATEQDVRSAFGDEVMGLVDGVTKLSKAEYEGKRTERQIGSLRKLLFTASEDARVIIIKLADRWHNAQSLAQLKSEKQQRIALETLDIYVPFARIMGLWELKRDLENLCFPLAYRDSYLEWHTAVELARNKLLPEREAFVQRMNSETSEKVQVYLVQMSDYELFQKLNGSVERLEESQNIDSVLLVISNEQASAVNCYTLLGSIHQHYAISPTAMRDYINAPRPNGYQSLHTTIFLSIHHQVRLRLQTQEMYDNASKRKFSMADHHQDLMGALRSLHRAEVSTEQFVSDLQSQVLNERIRIFTPAGEMFALPSGATGIDFAFGVNPDHLPYLLGIRVNGEEQPVLHELKDGDTVELLLSEHKQGEMRAMWIEKMKTPEAREMLKKALNSLPQDRKLIEGRKLLENECRKRRLPSWWLFHLARVQDALVQALGQPSFDILLEQVGTGQIAVSTVANAYRQLLVLSPTWTTKLLRVFNLLPRSRILSHDATVIDLEIFAEDRPGLIYDITRQIAERKINISKFGVYAVPPKDALYQVRIETKNFETYSQLFDSLLSIPNVKNITRKR